MLKNTNVNKGFTLVELLIVIVVIAILAAISIVAYNGIQDRGKTSSAASAASTISKKAEAANAIESEYPDTLAEFEVNDDTSLTGSGIVLGDITATAPPDPATVDYEACADGARVAYYDYSAGAKSAWKNIGETCTTYTAVTSTGAL